MNITIEELIEILSKRNVCAYAATYNGASDRFVSFDGLLKELKKLEEIKKEQKK